METITIIHFNDVYHMERAPKFSTELRQAQRDNPSAITIFCGDAFSPSKESAMVKGKHMVPILNHLGIDVAMYGNHDLDFGLEILNDLSKKNDFTWLMSNFKSGEENVANSKDYHIATVNGTKIGFIGLAGK